MNYSLKNSIRFHECFLHFYQGTLMELIKTCFGYAEKTLEEFQRKKFTQVCPHGIFIRSTVEETMFNPSES